MSLPTRERELKQKGVEGIARLLDVAPHAGARIETLSWLYMP